VHPSATAAVVVVFRCVLFGVSPVQRVLYPFLVSCFSCQGQAARRRARSSHAAPTARAAFRRVPHHHGLCRKEGYRGGRGAISHGKVTTSGSRSGRGGKEEEKRLFLAVCLDARHTDCHEEFLEGSVIVLGQGKIVPSPYQLNSCRTPT